MALTITWVDGFERPDGLREATFTVLWDDDYTSAGKTCDVSSYFSGSPKLTANPIEATGGYCAFHNGGTASAGTLRACLAIASSTQAGEPADSTDMSNITTRVTFVGTAA